MYVCICVSVNDKLSYVKGFTEEVDVHVLRQLLVYILGYYSGYVHMYNQPIKHNL